MARCKTAFCLILLIALCLSGCTNKNNNDSTDSSAVSSDTEEIGGRSDSEEPKSSIGNPLPGRAENKAGYGFTVPQGFTEMELEGFEFYYSAEDGSSINLNIQPAAVSFDQTTAALLNETLASVLSQSYDTGITVTDHFFSADEISGYPAYQYSFSYELQGNLFRHLVVCINADQCYTFTFTDLSGDWMETFEECASEIALTTG